MLTGRIELRVEPLNHCYMIAFVFHSFNEILITVKTRLIIL